MAIAASAVARSGACQISRRSGLGRGLDGPGQLVQHVRGLVHPAPLVPRRGEDLLQRLPEAERAVAGGQLGRDGEAARLEVDQQLPPALRALAHADLEAEQLLLALRGGADQHQHALGLRLHARLQVDAVGPDDRRSAAPTGRAAASARSPPPTRRAAARPPTATGSARPCPAALRAPPGSRPSRPRAGRGSANAQRRGRSVQGGDKPDQWSGSLVLTRAE